jgi:hypothetical protein
VLDGHISEADLARQLNRSIVPCGRCSAWLLAAGVRRARKIGRLIFYNVEHVRDWISQHEQRRKPAGSVSPPRDKTTETRLGPQSRRVGGLKPWVVPAPLTSIRL